MKNKFLYIVLVITSIISSCKEDDFEPLNDVAECTWHMSTEAENISPIQLNLKEYISIMDLSQGNLSHEWTVSDDGTKFLSGKMQWGQKEYDNLVDESIPHVNNEKTIHVYFTKAGDHTIRLRNTFSKQVVYPYSEWSAELQTYVKKYTYARKEGDVYVMDTTFHVRVYDLNLVPAIRMYSDPECTQEIKMGQIGGTEEAPEYETYELEYGKSLYVKDDSYGLPNYWKLVCYAAGFEQEFTDFPDVYELKLKKFSDKPLNLNLTVERKSDPNNKYQPTAMAKSVVVPLNIKVVPTQDPVSYKIRQIDQWNIAIDLENSEFGYKPIDVSALTLNYRNNYNGNNNSGTIAINKAEVNNTHRYELKLTLGEKIYNTDDLILTGTLRKALYGDADLTISSSEPNVVTTYASFLDDGFEYPSTYEDWKVVKADVLPAQYQPSSVVDNPLQNAVNSSAKCLRVDAVEFSRSLISKPFKGGKGTYTIKYKYYVPGEVRSGLTAWFVPSDKPGQQDPSWLETPTNKLPWETLQSGIWKEVTGIITSKAEMESVILSLRFNYFFGEIYFDDIFFGYIEVRP